MRRKEGSAPGDLEKGRKGRLVFRGLESRRLEFHFMCKLQEKKVPMAIRSSLFSLVLPNESFHRFTPQLNRHHTAKHSGKSLALF